MKHIILGGIIDNFHCRVFNDAFVFRDLGMLQKIRHTTKKRVDLTSLGGTCSTKE
jgi:hypothetical protein